MSKTAFLISPEAPPEAKIVKGIQRRLNVGELRVGMLDNGKSNADHLLRFLLDGLKEQFPVTSVVWLRKASMSTPAPQTMIEQFVAETDLVITAMGD